MLTRIGKPSEKAADAVDLLLECHARIRSFLGLAGALAQAGAGEPGLAEAAARVRRYFDEALPLHARDEEESIAPRLRGRDPGIDHALDTMAREHAEHERSLAVVLATCQELAVAPERLPDLAPRLAQAVTTLDRQLAAHLQQEEAVVFPAMRRLLEPDEDAAVVREIRARRAVPPRSGAPAEDPVAAPARRG